ncbi:MAG: flagellar basal-body MS-ring/collar protein FliF, partial [Deltaproteobacteria bacterium]
MTEFVQKVNYKRALQGELARTISQIKEVETARVHIAMPEKGVFLDEQKKSRASIILKLKPGKSLTSGQVNAIVHLVANSFENLKPADVTVVDTSGRMWTKAAEDGDNAAGLSATQLEYKRSIEKDFETRIQTMLEKAVGTDKAVARVSADVDTRQVERTEETFDPDSQVVRSEQKNKEKSIGGTTAVGVPGVLSNMPDGTQKPGMSTAVSTPSQSQRQNDVINYEINKVVSRVIEPVGSIKRITVSVLVDGAYEASRGADGKEVRKYAPRSDEEIRKFTEMVKGVVGYSEKRGDVITVLNTPFEADIAEGGVEAEKTSFISNIASKQPYLLPMAIKYATILTIVMAAFFVILRPILKRINEERAALQAIEKSLPEGAGYASPELPSVAVREDKDQVEAFKSLV